VTETFKNPYAVPVAIIGMAGLFPKSAGLKAYWRLLFQGTDGITDIPDTHWSTADYYDVDPKKPDHVYCMRGGFLSPIPFDPTEFGIPPSSLEATDTSQLFGLIAAKMAFEDAGYGEERSFDRDRTSVILGVTGTQELVIPLSSRLGFPLWRRAIEQSGISTQKAEEIIERIGSSYVNWKENSFPGLLGNVVAGRISNRLNLGGTNCVVDAACASSLSALTLSILELAANRSDMVLTGGVDTLNDIFMHMCFAKTHTLSTTGDARPFSKDADGTVLGEGAGMLVLKRLTDAERDGDRIYAVIRGIGSSSDGKSQSIYAPRVEGQEKALRSAYTAAGVDPFSVELLEAHGTGTKVGDRVEFQALTRVFGNGSENRCALGSVKSMIGHTKAAAGAAGILKAALALHHKVLPPTLKADEADPSLQIQQSPFYLNTKIRPWFRNNKSPRRAGVSAFGFGGSNFHVVLEEYASGKKTIAWDGSVEIAAFSGATPVELAQRVDDFDKAVEAVLSEQDFVYGISQTRAAFSHGAPWKVLLVLDHASEPFENRKTATRKRLRSAVETIRSSTRQPSASTGGDIFLGGPEKPGKICFLFPGQGSQYLHMGCDLACIFPQAFEVIEKADLLNTQTHRLSDLIYPAPTHSVDEKAGQQDILRQTENAQPAIGAVSLAMMKVLRHFGIRPDITCGHSFGELTALCAAGWIDEETFFRLALSRGELMAAAGRANTGDPGAMLAVKAPLHRLEAIIEETGADVVLANRNSPDQGVLSGASTDIDRLEKECLRLGFQSKKLPVSAAFHSAFISGAKAPFEKLLGDILLTPSDISVFSNTTARAYPTDPKQAKALLGKQLVHPVDFTGGIKNIYRQGASCFVEIGPKSVLSGLVKSILAPNGCHILSMDPSGGSRPGISDLARVICRLAALGYPVDLNKWEAPKKKPRKQMMQIPICGANYRPQNSLSTGTRSAVPQKTPAGQNNHMAKKNETIRDDRDRSMSNSGYSMEQKKQSQADAVAEALRVVQEGLRSMQVLQRQTAEAHQKFLDTQTQSTRTLRDMMENARRLAEKFLGYENVPSDLERSGFLHSDEKDHKAADDSNAGNGIRSEEQIPEPLDLAARHRLEQTLLQVVADLTGYPVETIQMDMDIEADLGIDSIKRVEILSALEEKIPDLPPVAPDRMGSLKTLAQIAEYFLSDFQPSSVARKEQQPDIEKRISACRSIPPARPESGRSDIGRVLLQVVADLTGYPVETIQMDMDIEADLGIDSIKRVEILSALEEKIPDLPPVAPDRMGSLKTLAQIAEYFSRPASTVLPPIDRSAEKPPIDDTCGTIESAGVSVERQVVTVIEKARGASRRLSISPDRAVYIPSDERGLAGAIAEAFSRAGIKGLVVSWNALKENTRRPKPAGLVLLCPDEREISDVFLKDAFVAAKTAAPDLLEAARTGDALFATISTIDGAFGFYGRGVSNPMQGGLAGLAKTAAIEWENVSCRAFDISPAWSDMDAVAQAVVDELLHPDSPESVEIGLGPGFRCVPGLSPSPFRQRPAAAGLDLGSKDVLIVTGGARGITAAAVLELLRHATPSLILVGSSAEPGGEPEWLAGLSDPSEIKAAILKNDFPRIDVPPVKIEAAFKRYTADREIRRNLNEFERLGARVRYHCIDIRQASALEKLIADIRSTWGPVTGIIHGAGVLEDRLIQDKTLEQFEKVFDTKVNGMQALLAATREDPLKYIVMFSSVSARFGNRGQADYAMANEVLNKIAHQESMNRPNCRVVSINWGPWDGGMVAASLKREFERKGVSLIPMDQGPLCMIYEMTETVPSGPEVIVGATLLPHVAGSDKPLETPVEKARPPADQKENLSLAFQREIDVQRHPILSSHVLGGKPVVPFALMTEWLGHGALHANPGLELFGLDDIRLFKGIRLDREKRLVRLLAGKTKRSGSVFEVTVEMRDGIYEGAEIIHSRARAILSEELPPPPKYEKSDFDESQAGDWHIDDIYENILFHGRELRGISKIYPHSSRIVIAKVSAAPSPDKWMTNPLRSRWIADPLVIDSAFQMAIVWSFKNMGLACLPSCCAGYRQYRREFPQNGVRAVMEVTDTTEHKIRCDFVFFDGQDAVVATLNGYEAIMDASLLPAFKANKCPSR